MKTIQEKVLEAIEILAKQNEFECIKSETCSNVGTIYITPDTELAWTSIINYSFQPGSFTLDIIKGNSKKSYYIENKDMPIKYPDFEMDFLNSLD